MASASRTAAQARRSGEKLKESRSNKLERVSPRLGGQAHQPRLRSQGCKRREGAARSPLRLKRSDSESERVTSMSRDRRRSSVLRCERQQARRRSLGCVKNCSASAVGLQKLRGAESAKEQNNFLSQQVDRGCASAVGFGSRGPKESSATRWRREGAARSPLKLKRSEGESERATPMLRDRRQSSVLRCERQQARRRHWDASRTAAQALWCCRSSGELSQQRNRTFSLSTS